MPFCTKSSLQKDTSGIIAYKHKVLNHNHTIESENEKSWMIFLLLYFLIWIQMKRKETQRLQRCGIKLKRLSIRCIRWRIVLHCIALYCIALQWAHQTSMDNVKVNCTYLSQQQLHLLLPSTCTCSFVLLSEPAGYEWVPDRILRFPPASPPQLEASVVRYIHIFALILLSLE